MIPLINIIITMILKGIATIILIIAFTLSIFATAILWDLNPMNKVGLALDNIWVKSEK